MLGVYKGLFCIVVRPQSKRNKKKKGNLCSACECVCVCVVPFFNCTPKLLNG